MSALGFAVGSTATYSSINQQHEAIIKEQEKQILAMLEDVVIEDPTKEKEATQRAQNYIQQYVAQIENAAAGNQQAAIR